MTDRCQYTLSLQYLKNLEEQEQRLRADPEDEEALRRRAESYDSWADAVRTAAFYETRFNWELAPVLKNGDLEHFLRSKRRQWILEWMEAAADSAEPWILLADVEPDDEQKLLLLETVRERFPDDFDVVRHLSEILRKMERSAEALDLLRRFVSDRPESKRARWLLINVLQRAGLEGEARAVLRDTEESFADDRGVQREVFWRYRHDGYPTTTVAAKFEELKATAPSVAELSSLCGAASSEGWLEKAESCYEEVLRRSAGAGVTGDYKHRSAVKRARDELLKRRIERGDWSEIERFVAAQGSDGLVGMWSTIVRELGQEGGCGRFLTVWKSGAFAPALADREADPWSLRSVAHMLESCDAAEELAVLEPFAAEVPFRQVPGQLLQLTRERVEAEIESVPFEDLQKVAWKLPLREVAGLFERWYAANPQRRWARLTDMAGRIEKLGGSSEATAFLERLAARHPEELDLELWVGVRALAEQDHRRVQAAAGRVLAARDATNRQRSEARYLLGRVARREGRLAEASEHLETYFLQRIRFVGCCKYPHFPVRPCDREYLLHLLGARDLERYVDYLQRRAEARDWFMEFVAPAASHLECSSELEAGFLADDLFAVAKDTPLRSVFGDRFFAGDALLSLARRMQIVN